jgi:3-oxoacyl-[acyl-carrier protein] reductase
MHDFEKNLPLGRAGKPDEIGSFVKAIIKNNIKYLNGVILNFDGGLSKNLI